MRGGRRGGGPRVLIKTLRNSSRNIFESLFLSIYIDIFLPRDSSAAIPHSPETFHRLNMRPCRSSHSSPTFTSAAPLLLSMRAIQRPRCRGFLFPFRLPSKYDQEEEEEEGMNKEERVRDSRFKFSRSSNESSNLPSFEEEEKKRGEERKRSSL